MKKKIFAVLALAFLLALSMAPAAWAADDLSGQCGENVNWRLENGWLIISGSGAMTNYTTDALISNAPWSQYKDNIKNIRVETGVTTIGNNSFVLCNELSSITLPDTIRSIGDYAFLHCGNFKSINIPDGVSTIGKEAFSHCPALEVISIPDSVTSIGETAFGWTGLRNVVIPDSVTTIEPHLFYMCTDLNNVQISNNATSIGDGAFYGCYDLTNIEIPSNVNSIGEGAFSYCVTLQNLDIPNSVTNIGDGLFNMRNSTSLLKNVHLPERIVDIPARTFLDCENLSVVNIPNTVKTIKSQAFLRCHSLTSINIPISVELIDEYAFDGCENLKDIYYAGNKEQWNNIIVRQGNEPFLNATIHYLGDEESTIPVTGVTLNKTALNLEVGGTATLQATIAPENATNKNVAFASSNEKVATVDNTGKVTALTKGTATITAAADGIKAECVVTVTADDVYTITFDTDGGTLAAGITNPDYVIKGETYKMPGASKSRYTLKAWAIGSKDSQTQAKANDVYTFTEDTTVYAIWQYNGGGGGSHGGSSRPSGTTTKPGTTEKPGDTNKPGTTTDNNKTVTAANVNNKFADVQNNAWYSEAIAYVYNKGMMNGTDAGKFEPDATTTRAMLVTMLFRLEGEPKAGAADFSDVVSGQWFSEAIAWAAASGVVNGYENGTFAPNAAITREQLAVILWRYVGSPAASAELNFSDAATVSDWAQQAMQWAVSTGIINGDNGALRPAGNATRAEVAMMLMRFCENISGK
jgi:Bacterial surface proteins containing Ig-like domains